MQIGQLNKRITIQSPTQAADGMGGLTTSWADVTLSWAAIWPVSATETIKSNRPVGELTHRIRIRYRSGIRPSYRIKYEDKKAEITRYFDISGPPINVEERNEWLDMICKESV